MCAGKQASKKASKTFLCHIDSVSHHKGAARGGLGELPCPSSPAEDEEEKERERERDGERTGAAQECCRLWGFGGVIRYLRILSHRRFHYDERTANQSTASAQLKKPGV